MVLDLKPARISAVVRSHRFDFSFLHLLPELVAYTVTFLLVAMDMVPRASIGGTPLTGRCRKLKTRNALDAPRSNERLGRRRDSVTGEVTM